MGEGFAFFRWRVTRHPYVGDDAGWWEFYMRYDLMVWRLMQEIDGEANEQEDANT